VPALLRGHAVARTHAEGAMKFGVFDHLDDAGVPLKQLYADRLALIEAYDRSGIYGYHLAEHHSTPLGCAPSPGLFLAAVAQRTATLRFGPLVYLLPFYHPLRLIEEICMLDQLSGGRFQLGVGRGVSPFETRAYGLDFAATSGIYHEAFELILRGLAADELTFEGKHYQFRNVPMILRPLQRPHPPLWYGTTIAENADWPATNDVNIVTIALRPTVRTITDRYRAARMQLGKDPNQTPLVGVARHVVVAGTDREALAIARRAYPRWRDNFRWLFARHGAEPRIGTLYPPSFDELMAIDNGVAGSPATVRDFLAAELKATGCNYLLAWLCFGDMTLAESLASLELFAREVMPAFAGGRADAAE
jgi:alkanesulfonate monooxygenase SsuD/methylene tetrahydromethanopterin reductase-like flavin-dependent oxidoreductase (luciferase family)